MASPNPHPCVGDVRIAIICALTLEYDAVKLAFEHIWEEDQTRDGYGYSLGRIGDHVSLLVCCEAGKASAAGAASNIQSRYRGIKLAIVTGICGGVPGVGTDRELRLGDVVISTSIFQYDYGRRNTDKFRPKQGIEDALPSPVREICSFLNILQTRDAHKKLQNETHRVLQEMQRAEPKTYERPEDTEDYLYEAEYVHRHRQSPPCDCDESVVCDQALEATCEELGCKDSFVVQRPRRAQNLQGRRSSLTTSSPGAFICVLFGGVGSGDTVMKSGRDRDDMAKRHNLVALEMEGAGVRKHINDSIVIKSVCDYADSHKNKNWQHFAAAVAASTTKALLGQFSYEDEPGIPQVRQKYDQIESRLLPLLAAEHERYKDFNPEKIEGTCEWFFQDHRFLEWLNSPSGIIWVSAGPGCGKSVLAKALIDEQRLVKDPGKTTVCYFFFKAGEERRTGSSDALSAVLHQLFDVKRGTELIQYAEGPFKNYKEKLRDNFHQLWDILMSCAKSPDAGEIVCVLDALDECSEIGRQEILKKLKTFDKAQSRLKFLITGRPYDHLEDEFEELSERGICIQLDGDDKSEYIREEINLVIDHKVNIIAKHWEQFGVEHRQQLLNRLKGMENRTYLWLHLTMDIIDKRRSRYRKYSSIEKLLEQLPLDAFEAYEKILNHSQDEVKARCLLQIILAARQPLTLQELNHCFALQEERFSKNFSCTYDDLQAELEPSTTFGSTVRNLCGLFISVHDGKVSFIHKTARDFLVTDSALQKAAWQGKFRLTLAHNVMFVSCVRLLSLKDFDVLIKDMVVLPWKDVTLEVNRDLPFISYAVLNWSDHYNSQDEENKIKFLKEARGLCHVPYRPGQAPLWLKLRENLCGGHSNDWTDLTISSYLGLLEVVVHILDREKVHVNERGGWLGTADMFASYLGHANLVRTLCQHGADCDAASGRFRTVLLAAVSEGRLEVMNYLLDDPEYASGGDLLAFYRNRKIPRADWQRKQFWQSIFRLLGSLIAIDDFMQHHVYSRETWHLRGTHQDIRPQNILLCGNPSDDDYSVPFKFADMGIAHIRKVKNEGINRPAVDQFGNGMYSAPEAYRDNGVATGIGHKSDVYSLGGILSETLIWTIWGERGREAYQAERVEATRKFRLKGGFHEGAFHDGDRILHVVENWHKRAVEITDGKADALSQLILKSMLAADPDRRQTAARVFEAFEALIPTFDSDSLPQQYMSQRRQGWPTSPFSLATWSQTTPAGPSHMDQSPTHISRESRISSFQTNMPSIAPFLTHSPFPMEPSMSPLDTQTHENTHLIDALHINSQSDSQLESQHDVVVYGSRGKLPASASPPPSSNSPLINDTSAPQAHNSYSLPTQAPDNSEDTVIQTKVGSSRLHGDSPVRRSEHLSNGESSSSMSATLHRAPSSYFRDNRMSQSDRQTTMRRGTSSDAAITVDQIYQKCMRPRRNVRHALSLSRSLPWNSDAENPLKQFPDLEEPLSRLRGEDGRNPIFIVDDSKSMQHHQEQAARTCRVLGKLLKKGGVDNDGEFELYFASKGTCHKVRDSTELERLVDASPFSNPRCEMRAILDQVATKVIRKNQMVSIYVLTNGHWNLQDPKDLCGVEKPIERIVKHMVKKDHQGNWAMIQFVGFYRDLHSEADRYGKARLKYLDDSLKLERDIDIVDTRNAKKDVTKILLGSFSTEADDSPSESDD